MTHPLLDHKPHPPTDVDQRPAFLVLRQDPDTREYRHIGCLDRIDGRYRFRYSDRARLDESLTTLPGFPDRQRTYESTSLFATFANRVMTPRRDSYRQYLRRIGLEDEAPEPFEVLARTWGTRATDRIQLLPIPRVDSAGLLQSRFLVHGGRHVDPVCSVLRTITVGDLLELRHEPANPEDSQAVLVMALGGAVGRLGYVPRPLSPFIHRLRGIGVEPTVVAEHINLPEDRLASDQMRLLVRLEAQVPSGFDVMAALGTHVAGGLQERG